MIFSRMSLSVLECLAMIFSRVSLSVFLSVWSVDFLKDVLERP